MYFPVQYCTNKLIYVLENIFVLREFTNFYNLKLFNKVLSRKIQLDSYYNLSGA